MIWMYILDAVVAMAGIFIGSIIVDKIILSPLHRKGASDAVTQRAEKKQTKEMSLL
jgi:hypothetical protein